MGLEPVNLVPSLLHAIVGADGEALVLHASEKPYVVSPKGQVELATRALTLEAVNGIIGHVLPLETYRALDEFGAIQYEIPVPAEFPGEQFTIVAARGGDDLWVEIRRRRARDHDRAPKEHFAEASDAVPAAGTAAPASAPPSAAQPVLQETQEEPAFAPGEIPEPIRAADFTPIEQRLLPPGPAAHELIEAPAAVDALQPVAAQLPPELIEVLPATEEPPEIEEPPAIEQPAAIEEWQVVAVQAPPFEPIEEPPVMEEPPEIDEPGEIEEWQPVAVTWPPLEPMEPPAIGEWRLVAESQTAPEAFAEPAGIEDETEAIGDSPAVLQMLLPSEAIEERPPADGTMPGVSQAAPEASLAPTPAAEAPPATPVAEAPVAEAPAAAPQLSEAPRPEPAQRPEPRAYGERPSRSQVFEPPQPAVVLPIARSPIRVDQTQASRVEEPQLPGLERLLRLAVARGASTLYLASDAQPSVRADGELQVLDGEPVLTARDVEALLLALMPERGHEALRTGAATEWISDIAGVGRVRCVSFRDHAGPGGVFRLIPTWSISVEQLGLPREVQALADEPEGLVLVAGPRSSGKRTMIAALVDLINRTRREHVITIEREINAVHAPAGSLISQREVRGGDAALVSASRAALREDPDVLVIEDLRTRALVSVALEAAAAGRLVIGGFSAHTATSAIDRIIDLYAPEQKRQVQFALADTLRGVVVQVLLRRASGGRVPAREVLLNTPAVSALIAEGRTSQLPMAIEGGRRHGMMPLSDGLVALVQSGTVEGSEAYRHAADRAGLVAALERQGVDTSFLERLA